MNNWEKEFDKEVDKFGKIYKVTPTDKKGEMIRFFITGIKNFISQREAEIRKETIEAVLFKIKNKLERIKLDMDVIICDCGEPYKGTDPSVLIDELLSEVNELAKEKFNISL